MKQSLWIIIVLTAAFVGYVTGYSVPPLAEVGMLTGGTGTDKSTQLDESMEEYYKELQSD